MLNAPVSSLLGLQRFGVSSERPVGENNSGESVATSSSLLERLGGPEREKLLERIDKFRELGLVVVGDQSSGKSSLLEVLTELPFPIAGDVCTRFATHIVFRRSPIKSTKITILPSPDADDDHKRDLEEFDPGERELTRENFATILEEVRIPKLCGGPLRDKGRADMLTSIAIIQAKKCMELPPDSYDSNRTGRRFSDDVLKIEISGPNQEHLSFVDLPGLFHNPTGHQTVEDAIIVRELIQKYIEQDRTIILAVMDGRNNLANQGVFKMAKEADEKGHRTVGVITKLDAVPPGDEYIPLRIARNEEEKLHHGWYCVKNRSTEEIKNGLTLEDRSELEVEFFKKTPWNTIPSEKVGIPALKKFISSLLDDLIKEEFSKLTRELEDIRDESQLELEGLGEARETPEQQRNYLLRLSQGYQRQVDNALTGNYVRDTDEASKLRMHIRRRNAKFAEDMENKGHTYKFSTASATVEASMPQHSASDIVDEEEGVVEKASRTFANGSAKTHPEIYNWIGKQYRNYRGIELPTQFNHILIAPLFRQQTAKWAEISRAYIDDITRYIRDFNISTFLYLCPGNESASAKLLSRLEPLVRAAVNRAHAQLRVLLSCERDGFLQTENKHFAANLQAAHLQRATPEFKSMDFMEGRKYTSDANAVGSIVNVGSDAVAVHEIHDVLSAFYDVSRSRFVDAVIIQIVEGILLADSPEMRVWSREKPIDGVPGPVRAFGLDFVYKMSEAELSAVAGEEKVVANRRDYLLRRVDRLNEALKD